MKEKFEIYKDHRGEFRFRLKAPNGEIIAVSGEGFTSKQSCQKSIEAVRKYAVSAQIHDLT